MNYSEKNIAAAQLETTKSKKKKKELKKPLAERLAGKAPFSWLKVDPTIAMGQ
ncbi:MAG: hypothetical protein ACRC01_00715 [Deefgea sp.]